MYDSFVRNRITELRMKKGVTEYRMSRDLCHSKSYIQSISSGKALPSLSEFFSICEYLDVTPREFFDTEIAEPQLVHNIMELTKTMNSEDLSVLFTVAAHLSRNKEK